MLTLVLVIVGIPLIIVAWKRGWKGWALLPIPVAWLAIFVMGFIWGTTLDPEIDFDAFYEEHTIEFLLIDILPLLAALAVLIGMITKPRLQRGAIDKGAIQRSSSFGVFCPNCGLEQVDNAKFCRSCGTRVGES